MVGSPRKIGDGDYVLVYQDVERNWLLKAEKDKQFHSNNGILEFNEVIGKLFGSRVNTRLGVTFTVFEPIIRDFSLKVPRKTNIVHPKDAGLIIVNTGIGPGYTVVEAGAGSGALTIQLAHLVKPDGHITSYEIREGFVKLATKNIKKVGLDPFVTIKKADVIERIEEENVDLVVLDLASPWAVVKNAYNALKPSGMFVSYSPTINQVMRCVEVLEQNLFQDIRTIECLVRAISVKSGKTRPESRMVGHTGYITFARKSIE